MFELCRKLAIFSCFLFTSFCFWKVGVGLTGGVDTEILPSAQAAMSPSLSPPRVVTTPIQQMRPGMRIVGRNPIRLETEATIDPTPEGWRLVSVRMLKEDGTYFEAELLRPLSWIHRHRAQPGAVIELNMPEMYVVGAAEVLSISPCPPIDPGDGPVVLSTFKNTANNVLNLYVEGETEPIGVTAGHPIWSEDRQAFVHSEKLQPGERLRSALGKTVRITSIEIRAGPEPVYNLEVAGEHVYNVTDSGLLVHNTAECVRQRILANIAESKSARAASNFGKPVTAKGSYNVLSSNHLVSQFDTFNISREAAGDIMIDTGIMRNFVAEGSNMRHVQKAVIGNRRIIATQTAVDEFRAAMVRTGSIQEQLRANRLINKLTVVPDNPSSTFSALTPSRKMGANDIDIFGTADRFGIEILTTDRTFMRTFYNRTGHTINGQWFVPYVSAGP